VLTESKKCQSKVHFQFRHGLDRDQKFIEVDDNARKNHRKDPTSLVRNFQRQLPLEGQTESESSENDLLG
jgi:hypothetical protein